MELVHSHHELLEGLSERGLSVVESYASEALPGRRVPSTTSGSIISVKITGHRLKLRTHPRLSRSTVASSRSLGEKLRGTPPR